MAKDVIKALFNGEQVVTESSDLAKELYEKSRFGIVKSDKRVVLSLFEACYLIEKKRINVFTPSGKKMLTFEDLIKKCKKLNKNFLIKYSVFKDIRERGYIIKTALKFGADFRVYDRGVKPGEDHAKWVVFPVHEADTQTWHEFAAKNRVAHSTKKKLLIGVVDDEGDVSYWECRWVRP
ncbi:tRNA-intron lyase [Candidatus Woesearchaeota archaeon]|nr:tRNA-intron lyase [Candidatus Woesearchaeota archaeon]MBW2978861.1 tRNA-intron lyase [Candidatus Woesearchaeota archaeon]